jgi:hypothetical protein
MTISNKIYTKGLILTKTNNTPQINKPQAPCNVIVDFFQIFTTRQSK